MTGRYRAYTAYKDSGVEWLGKIPKDWKISKIKYVSSIFGRIGFRGYTVNDIVDAGEGAIVLSPSNIEGDSLSLDKKAYLSWDKYYESPEIMLEDGDVLLVKTGSTYGKSTIVKEVKEPMTINPQMALLKKTQISSSFLAYLLNSRLIQATIEVNNTGSGMPTMTQENINSFPVPHPPVGIPSLIVNFLDHETSKIDTLIEKQQQLIKLLGEKRQAVISHAVTKGLNPDAPMKDSDVAWLGEVPGHWVCCSLKHYALIIDCKHITAEFFDEGIPLASISEVKGWYVNLETAKYTNEKYYLDLIDGGRAPLAGDIIYSRNATVGEAAIVGEDMPSFAMGQDVCLIRLSKDLFPEYALFVLKSGIISQQLDLAMVGSTFKRINVDNIRNFSIALPPRKEQVEIINELNRVQSKYRILVSKAQSAIELMQERRTALISAAVTGKIDVRNWQAPIPKINQTNKDTQ